MSFSSWFLDKFVEIIKGNRFDTEEMVKQLAEIKKNSGRVFFIGNGGSAATAGHGVNDFRKIANIESYAITDNVAELTARINDDGFEHSFDGWLKVSNLNKNDAIMVLSVGGGSKKKNISNNIVNAIDYGKLVGCKILGIVGKDGGYTAENADCIVLIPTVDDGVITPIVESFHSIILHLLVSHPLLKENETKWESTK
jgi:D-sedoheptulose 7-phosphate isomerase